MQLHRYPELGKRIKYDAKLIVSTGILIIWVFINKSNFSVNLLMRNSFGAISFYEKNHLLLNESKSFEMRLRTSL